MALEKLHRRGWESSADPDPVLDPIAPGKTSLTQRMNRPGLPGIVFRVESAEAARELAGLLGPRDGNGVAAGAGAAVEQAAQSSGTALPSALRERFESSLGADLSGVRVHTGAESADAASAVGARAYTVGNDIHFGADQYDPGSSAGVHLIAHEVAHTVQQAGSTPTRQNQLEVSSPQDGAEVEADRAADAMLAGESFAVTSAASSVARDKNKKAGDGDKKEEEKPKFPSYVGDKQELKLPFKTGALTLNMSENPSATMEWKGEADHKFLDLDKTMVPQPVIAPGVVLDVAVAAKAGLGVSGNAGFKAGWEDAPGPLIEPTKQFTMSGFAGGQVKLGLEGGVKVGVGIGVPMGNIAGGAELALEASSSIGATLIAGGTRNPDGFWSGNIQMVVAGEAKLEAKGSLYIDAVIATDRYNLYSYQLGSHTIGSASITCIASVDLATGQPQDIPPIISYQWNGLPKLEPVKMRRLSEQERSALLPVNQGASGAPPDMGPEEVPCENNGQGGAASDCGPPPSSPNDGAGGAGG